MAPREKTQSIAPEQSLVPSAATVEHLRRLAVQASQRQELVAVPALDKARAAWLNESIEAMIPEGGNLAAARARNKLIWEGYGHRRDVLVAGAAKVRNIRSIGASSVGIVRDTLANTFGIEWAEKPSLDTLMAICPELLDVSSVAIALRPVTLYLGEPVTSERAVFSIQDILDAAQGEGLIAQVAPSESYNREVGSVLGHVGAARVLAVGFYATQLTMYGEAE